VGERSGTTRPNPASLARFTGIGNRPAPSSGDNTDYRYGRGDYRSVQASKPPATMLPKDMAEAIGDDFLEAFGGNLKAAIGQIVWVIVEQRLMTDHSWTP
jgi:hypothetical protein